MSLSAAVFCFISLMIIVFGILTVRTSRIFRAAIYLLFTLINVAALYFCLGYEFIAAVQVVVYVGGIVVLILFSLFLTEQSGTRLPEIPYRQALVSYIACIAGFGIIYTIILASDLLPSGQEAKILTMKTIGSKMLSYGEGGYILPFEAVSILLLAALTGSISIAFKTKKNE